jgi:hypothetical protein
VGEFSWRAEQRGQRSKIVPLTLLLAIGEVAVEPALIVAAVVGSEVVHGMKECRIGLAMRESLIGLRLPQFDHRTSRSPHVASERAKASAVPTVSW